MARNISVILLYDSKKRFLLQHRSDDSKRAPGKWGFFGGGIEKRENSLDAVKRECFEELFYTLKNPKFLFKEIVNVDDTMYVYVEEFDETKKLNLNEGKDMGWFFPEETKKLDIISHDREILLKINNKI